MIVEKERNSAGLIPWALIIPLNIRYAEVAGLPPVFGLYAGIIPLVVFALFTSSRHVVASPDAPSVQVMRRMNALINNLLEVLPTTRHAALPHWEERWRCTIDRSFKVADEKPDASVADRQGLGIGEEQPGDAK